MCALNNVNSADPGQSIKRVAADRMLRLCTAVCACSMKGVHPIQQVQAPDGTVWRPPQAAAVVPLLQQHLKGTQTAVDMQAWLP
jgi:hypothetical protein